eukprot:6018483-Prorocentrum_lima.AAC.1
MHVPVDTDEEDTAARTQVRHLPLLPLLLPSHRHHGRCFPETTVKLSSKLTRTGRGGQRLTRTSCWA